ncbi:helix-turn-helix domain-containing protein [Streptomyces sp. NPDC058653]|uniref:helix-turn-helix domain-containing protein n=1 Tax=Streptomyces sp. NPDC058653 TaxID=3346576 RepID=UPI00365DB62B
MTTPNASLRAVRMGMLMSQEEFAKAVRGAGSSAGESTPATKRLVQRWEAGETTNPRPNYARALEVVTGLPIESLGFLPVAPLARVAGDGAGGHDVAPSAAGVAPPAAGPTPQTAPRQNFSGVWLSRYEFFSSGRESSFIGMHYVVLLQHGNRITARSLPHGSSNPDSPLTLDLTLDGSVITGTWVEQTAGDGYYRGARYHGAIQMLVEPTGTRMSGKWVGFGKDMDVNSGPWELRLQDSSTTQSAIAQYNRRPE